MFAACKLGALEFSPARFCAPLAGHTHSAFRRLLSAYGGCGGVWTEMLAGRQVLSEKFESSPWVRRRAGEGRMVFQLMLRAGDPIDRILGRLGENGVEAVDVNMACDAFSIRACEAGSALFENLVSMRSVVTDLRRHWPGLLTAKIRLGSRRPDWEPRFAERLKLLEEAGVDAVTVHPRFFEDKFRRRARLELIPWVASLTRMPVIANGDLHGGDHVRRLGEPLRAARGVMIGRMAIVQPWVFAAWDGPVTVDYAEVWQRMFQFIVEDFPPATALRRVRMFTKYYAANFQFGHSFRVAVNNAASLEAAREWAEDFLGRAPVVVPDPNPAGL